MIRKFLIIAVALISILTQFAVAQSVAPLRINIETETHYDNAEWRWTPKVEFLVYGPVESGSVISFEYTLPNGKTFVTDNCETYPIKDGEWLGMNCGKNLKASDSINQIGLFGFQIKLGNPLSGENKVLYSGKFSIGKILYNPDGTPDKNKQFHYFVDNDWRLQYSYVGTFYGDTSNNLYVEFWVKNRIQDNAAIMGHLYYNGKEISAVSQSSNMNNIPKENPKQEFTKLGFNFQALVEKPVSEGWDEWFKVYENPGEYEFKLIRDKKLTRSFKFMIGKDGKPVSTGIGADLLKQGVLVPVQVLGEVDGIFDKTTWKNGIWGNPIKGMIVQ